MKIFKYNKDELKFEQINPKSYIKIASYILISFIILFIIGWASGTNKYITNHLIQRNEITDTLVVLEKPFTKADFIELIKDCNIKYPHIVVAQAEIESGNFTSEIFRHNHNMFGMRMARTRITTAEKEVNGFAYYRDWKDCVYDYAMYQSSSMSGADNEQEYFDRLGEKYAQDSSYVGAVKAVIAREKLRSMFDE